MTLTADSASGAIVGFAARLFRGDRSAVQEVEFGVHHGFGAIQFRGQVDLEQPIGLGDLDALAAALQHSHLVPTMELLIGLRPDGRTVHGDTPIDILRANLPAIKALGLPLVHWHLYPLQHENSTNGERLSLLLQDLCLQGLDLAGKHQFLLGIENNPSEINMLATPDACLALLDAVPGLRLVWDINHSPATHDAGFHDLAPRISALHVSDTPLPQINHHLPLGLGNVCVGSHLRALAAGGFAGPAILEIGGSPRSGGYGGDTDEALIVSRDLLLETVSAEA